MSSPFLLRAAVLPRRERGSLLPPKQAVAIVPRTLLNQPSARSISQQRRRGRGRENAREGRLSIGKVQLVGIFLKRPISAPWQKKTGTDRWFGGGRTQARSQVSRRFTQPTRCRGIINSAGEARNHLTAMQNMFHSRRSVERIAASFRPLPRCWSNFLFNHDTWSPSEA